MSPIFLFFFFNDTAPPESYTYLQTLSLHADLPILNEGKDEMDKPKKQRPDHPQSWGEAQDDEPDSVPAPKDDEERPHNREVEYEDLKVPKKEGVPPRPATEPAPGKKS